MSDLTFVAGDTAPSIAATLSNDSGVIDLTDAEVRFQMRLLMDRRFRVDAEAVIVSEVDGTVRYDWAEGDLSDAGEYQGQWQITYPDLTIQTTTPPNTITVRAE